MGKKSKKRTSKDETSLEDIEGRLWKMDIKDLMNLALQFDESPLRYFTLDVLEQMAYPKRHYVS